MQRLSKHGFTGSFLQVLSFVTRANHLVTLGYEGEPPTDMLAARPGPWSMELVYLYTSPGGSTRVERALSLLWGEDDGAQLYVEVQSILGRPVLVVGEIEPSVEGPVELDAASCEELAEYWRD